MTDVNLSYRNAAARGLPAFEALDQFIDSNLLAGSEPGLGPTTRILLADSKTLAQFSVVGLDSSKRLALATYAATAATRTIGSGNAALTFTAVEPGVAGNDISVIVLAAGTADVSVDGHEITVTPGTGAATATQVAAQINGDEAASLLVSVAPGGTGGSNVATQSEVQLTGGVDKVDVCGVLAHAATSGSSNTTIYGETFLTCNYNAGSDSPLVWDASFDTLAKKAAATVGNPNLIFRSRKATGSPGV